MLGNLGYAHRTVGQHQQAIAYYEQALVTARETGDRQGEGNILGSLAITHQIMGQIPRATELYEQALAIARETGDRQIESGILVSLANVHHMLRPGGKYLTVCFSEDDDPSFGGGGKYRETPLGTTLYFSSEQEIRTLLEPRFDIEELCTVQVPGKHRPHEAVRALSRKRG